MTPNRFRCRSSFHVPSTLLSSAHGCALNTAMRCASSKGHLTTAEALIATAIVIAISGLILLGFAIDEDRESLCGCDLISPIAERQHVAPPRLNPWSNGAVRIAAQRQGRCGGER